MNDSDASLRKRALRSEVRARRSKRSSHERALLESGLTTQLSTLIETVQPHSLAGFIPTETEPPIRPGLEAVHHRGCDVLLPISREDRTMDWAVHHPGIEPIVDALGMPAPGGQPVAPSRAYDVDLVLCPAALVDRSGHRLGWGLGYYDRFLTNLTRTPPIVAVVFDDDIVDALPHEPHDVRVSGILTPTRLIWL